MKEVSVREFVVSQKELLEQELKAEEEEERTIASSIRDKSSSRGSDDDERPAHVLRHLEASDISVGLYGRTVVTLTVMGAAELAAMLPPSKFSVGDEVEIHSKQGSSRKDTVGGVISQITETEIAIALFAKKPTATGDDNDEDDNGFLGTPPLSVIPKSSVEVHRKLVKALDELDRQGCDHPVAGKVIQALFGSPQSFPESTAQPMEAFNKNLDTSQLEAVSFALATSRPIALIHGPPGTGKTTTVAELIHQAVHVHKLKVLVTAPSNVAVDNVLERLVVRPDVSKTKRRSKTLQSKKLKAVRLGHPARIKPSILPYSLESLVQNADGTEIVSDVRNELQSFLRILCNPKSRAADKRVAYREVKALRKEVKSREQKVVKDLVSEAQVILATNVGAANRMLDNVDFDLVVIDEAAQALEASCWIPALRGKRLVLAGDHCQLSPTIKSNAPNVQKQLGQTLFERTLALYGDDDDSAAGRVSRMLKVQYRMHEDIAGWASTNMYHGQLETYEGVKVRTLAQLPHVHNGDDDTGEIRLLLIDTAGCGMDETVNAAGSRYNDGEAQIVAKHVHTLLSMGLKQEEIAVISPYNGQVELLRTLLLPEAPKLEIRSVDGFQGGEREAVILSLVRSSNRGGIGFLKDRRRLNVAVTRAKRHCALVCDSETVSQSKFVKGLIDWVEHRGEHRSAMEYLSTETLDENTESDVRAAEAELLRLVEAAIVTTNQPQERVNLSSEVKVGEQKASGTRHAQERQQKAKEEERRKALLDQIAAFAETGQDGDELALSSELSRFDRKVVHEFATQLGIAHRSEGVDGVDRRIILSIRKTAPVAQEAKSSTVPSDTEDVDDKQEELTSQPLNFAALDIDSDSSSDPEENTSEQDASEGMEAPSMNLLLSSLAKERSQRQKDASRKAGQEKTAKRAGKKKQKGKKLGGNAKQVEKNDDHDDDALDDMAFLDAQIEKAQNSHGRKVEGKGQYRTIVNGILNAKAPPTEKQRNSRASSELTAKLAKAQDDRRRKTMKKK